MNHNGKVERPNMHVKKGDFVQVGAQGGSLFRAALHWGCAASMHAGLRRAHAQHALPPSSNLGNTWEQWGWRYVQL